MKNEVPEVGRVLIDTDRLTKRVKEIGKEISRDYEGKNPVMICLLKGAIHFYSDLTRQVTCPLQMDFMSVSSYGGTKSSGVVMITKDLDISITDRHIIIVDDIVDSGLTLNNILNILKTRKPASIKVVCLLDKPDRRECDVVTNYSGFVIPNEFVVGYGLDYNQNFRNLPYIGVLKTE